MNNLVQEELRQQREVTTSSLAQQLLTSERQLLRGAIWGTAIKSPGKAEVNIQTPPGY